MKKQLLKNLKLRAVMLVALLCAGVNWAWGEEVTTTYRFKSNSWETESQNWTSGKNGAGFSNGGIQVTTNTTGANGTSPESFANVTKIVVTYNTNKSAGAGSIDAKVGNNDATTNSVGYSGTADGRSANFTTVFTYNTPQSGAVKLTVNTTTNSIYLVSIAITTNSSAVAKTDPALAFSSETASATIGESFTAPTLTNTYNVAVNWASSDENIATVFNGAVTLVGEGETTITASFDGDDTYSSSSASYVLTVSDPSVITIWSEDFSKYSADDVPSGGTYGYACTNGNDNGTTKIYDQNNAGGTAPELLVAKSNGTFTAIVPLNNASGTLKLTYKTNAKKLSVSTTTEGISGNGSFSESGTHTVKFTGVTTSMTSITIVFTASNDNVRLDDIELRGVAQEVSVEAPTFSVNGGTYYSEQTVELTCEAEDATIYYSYDNENWTAYTNALTISETTTVYAKAIKGENTSTVSSATYTIAEKNDVVFTITDKSIAYGEAYTITRGTYAGRDIQSDGYVTVTSDNEAVASVSGMTIIAAAVGTATITLSVAEGDTYKAGSTTFEVTVIAPEGQTTAIPNTASIVFKETFDGYTGLTGGNDGNFATGSGTYSTTTNDNEGWVVTAANGALQCIKLGSGSTAGSATTPALGKAGDLTMTFKAAAWNNKDDGTVLNLSITGEGANLTPSSVTMSKSEWTTYTINISGATEESKITFSPSTENGTKHRFFLDEVEIIDPSVPAPSITATLNAKGYASYCSQYPLDFTDATDYSAWIVTGVNGSDITFVQLTGSVKGGTGLLLMGTPNSTINLPSVESETVPSGNLLEGTLAPKYISVDQYYGLSVNEFVPVLAGTVPAGKAILPASVVGDVKSLNLVFNDETGIREVRTISGEEAAEIFNLAGQRLQKAQKGVNIVNGKKVLIK